MDWIDDVIDFISSIFYFFGNILFSWQLWVLVIGGFIGLNIWISLDNMKLKKKGMNKSQSALALIEEAKSSSNPMEKLKQASRLSPQGRYAYAKALRQKSWKEYTDYVHDCWQWNQSGKYVLASRMALEGAYALNSYQPKMPGKPNYDIAYDYAKEAIKAKEPEAYDQKEAVEEAVRQHLEEMYAPLKAKNEDLKKEVQSLVETGQFDKVKHLLEPYAELALQKSNFLFVWTDRLKWKPGMDLTWICNAYGTSFLAAPSSMPYAFQKAQADKALKYFKVCKEDGTFYNRWARTLAWVLETKDGYLKTKELEKMPWADDAAKEAIKRKYPYGQFAADVIHIWRTGDSGGASPVYDTSVPQTSKQKVWVNENQQRDIDLYLGGNGKTLDEKLASGEMDYNDYLDWEYLNQKK